MERKRNSGIYFMTKDGKEYALDDLTIRGVKSEEKETTITIQGNDVRIFTSDNSWITKIRRVIAQCPEVWDIDKISFDSEGNMTGIIFTCIKRCISLRSGKKMSNNAGIEAMKAWRAQQSEDSADEEEDSEE